MLILVVALALRAWNLQSQSFSIDEVTVLRTSHKPVSEILHEINRFPPLFHVVMHGWLKLGSGDSLSRWLSVLCGLATVALTGALGTRVAGDKAGLGSAALLAVSPMHVHFSQENRAYSFQMMLAVAAAYATVCLLVDQRKRYWACYALALVAGLYTHYLFIVVLVATTCVLFAGREPAWLFKKQLRTSLYTALITYFILALTMAPWLYLLREDMQYPSAGGSHNPFGLVSLGYTGFAFVAGYSLGPSQRELHVLTTHQALELVWPWALAIGCALMILGREGAAALKQRGWLTPMSLFIGVPFLCIGALCSVRDFGYNVRYLVWVLPLCCVWLATGLAHPRNRALTAIAATLLSVVFVASLANRALDDRYATEDMRALGEYLSSPDVDTLPTFVLSGYMAIPLSYYHSDKDLVFPLPRAEDGHVDVPAAIAVMRNNASQEGGYWFVASRAFHDDPQGELRGLLNDQGCLSESKQFSGITLYRGVRLPGLAPTASLRPDSWKADAAAD